MIATHTCLERSGECALAQAQGWESERWSGQDRREKGEGDFTRGESCWSNIRLGLHERKPAPKVHTVGKAEYVNTRALESVDEQMALVTKK